MTIAAASSSQQYGLLTVSAGKSGFLTALYIIMVPMLAIFCKRKPSLTLCLAAFLALTGSYLLCGGIEDFGFGEACLILCAFFFSLHIMVIDRYAAQCDCIRLSCVQFASAALFAAAAALISGETWDLQAVTRSAPFWIFCGIGSSAIAFTLQIAAQKYLHPVTASLLMSLESVFAVIGGWLFLSEVLTWREIAGCAAIFAGVIAAQMSELRKKQS